MGSNTIGYGDITTFYSLCGPDYPDLIPGTGPRCRKCKAEIKETGEDTGGCGKYVPLATLRHEPEVHNG